MSETKTIKQTKHNNNNTQKKRKEKENEQKQRKTGEVGASRQHVGLKTPSLFY